VLKNENRRIGKRPSIILISTPGFAHGWSPLNIASLKSSLKAKRHRVSNLPLCVYFTDHITKNYRSLLNIDEEIGEFGYCWHEIYFSGLLFGHRKPEVLIRQTVKDMLENRDIYHTQMNFNGNKKIKINRDELEQQTRRIIRYCKIMHEFIIDKIDEIRWRKFNIVGFSCLEAQFLTSLFIARYLRQKHCQKATFIFGGPMFQPYSANSMLKNFREIDHIVIGKGKNALLKFLKYFEAGKAPPKLLNAENSSSRKISTGGDSDDTGTNKPPDFNELKKSGIRDYTLTTFLSSGCSHAKCSFCPISEKGQFVRSIREVYLEIKHQLNIHGKKPIHFADWEINGNPAKLEKLCDLLIANRVELDAWAEINPRNTSPGLLKKMKRAGICNVQVGIESFSPKMLKLMSKPATLLDNIKTLKWGIEADMETVLFNILCNHPLGNITHVKENFEVIKYISHLLRPPASLILNEMDLYRTSNMYTKANYFRVLNIKNYRYYERCYPKSALSAEIPMFNLAYRKHIVDPLWEKVGNYLEKIRKRPKNLRIRQLKNGLQVYDSRFGKAKMYKLDGLKASVLSASLNQVFLPGKSARQLGAPEEKILNSLEYLKRKKLVMQSANRYLGLPLRI